jgi:iron complex outermembrane receptor protein
MGNILQSLFLALLLMNTAFGQQSNSISGKIVTATGEAAAFVNIAIKGAARGTTTDSEGRFQIQNLKPGNYLLEVSFVGFQTQQKSIEVVEGQSTVVDFILVESSKELQEVVVSDSRSLNEKSVEIGKSNIKSMDLPQSIIVVDKALLETQQVARLSDVLVNTSGVYLMGTTGGVQEEIAGRGFSYGSTNTFKNGVRFNNGVMPEMSSLERVEILKGSAAILYGEVAAGGILNLVTKKPVFQNGGEVSFRAGSYNLYKPSIDLYGSLNNSDKIAYRFNTTYESANSFRDKVSSERIYFNPSFLIKAGKHTDILVEGDYLNDNRTLDYGTGAVNYEIANVPRSRFLGASWSNYKAIQKSATITVTHKFNEAWSLQTLASHQAYSNNQFGTTRPNASSQFVQTDGRWIRGLQRSGSDQSYSVVQVNLNAKFSTGKVDHQVLVGVEHDTYENKALAYVYENPLAENKNVYDTINIYDLSQYEQRSDIPSMRLTGITKNPSTRVGVYVQDLVSVVEKLKVLAGVRYSYMESGLAENETYDKVVSPRFGIVYQPIKEMSLFASYSNSFTPNTTLDVNNKRLAPSIIDQYEVGVKNELFKGFLSANVTAYQIVNSNLVQSVLPIPADALNQNNPRELAGEITSKGVELDVMSKSVLGTYFIVGYSYNDTRFTKSSQFIVGSRLRYNPSHTANASVYYKFENDLLKNLTLGFTTFYIGERVAGRSTRTNITNDSYKLMAVPNYFLFDLTAAYTVDRVSLRMKVSNVLNELSYNVHDDNSVNPIAPRQFSTTISYKF